MTPQVPKGRMIYSAYIFFLIILNDNISVSPLSLSLCSNITEWKIILLLRKNVLLDVYLCIKDCKIGKACQGPYSPHMCALTLLEKEIYTIK